LPVASLCTAAQHTTAATSQGTLYLVIGSQTEWKLSTCNISALQPVKRWIFSCVMGVANSPIA